MSTANEELLSASALGDVAGIGAALAGGADVNVVGGADDAEQEYSPLLWSAYRGHLAAFRALLAAGANPVAVCSGVSVVQLALYGGKPQVIREAVAARERVVSVLPRLHVAAVADDDGAAVRAVLARTDAGARAAVVGHTCRLVDRGGTALHMAAACGNVGAVQALLRAGADSNRRDGQRLTALHTAAQTGHTGTISELLAGGAAVDVVDDEGATPLWHAAREGFGDAIHVLLAGGADANRAAEDDCTPLFIACERGYAHVIPPLVAAGARVNQALSSGATPVYIAAQNGHVPVMQASGCVSEEVRVRWCECDGAHVCMPWRLA